MKRRVNRWNSPQLHRWRQPWSRAWIHCQTSWSSRESSWSPLRTTHSARTSVGSERPKTERYPFVPMVQRLIHLMSQRRHLGQSWSPHPPVRSKFWIAMEHFLRQFQLIRELLWLDLRPKAIQLPSLYSKSLDQMGLWLKFGTLRTKRRSMRSLTIQKRSLTCASHHLNALSPYVLQMDRGACTITWRQSNICSYESRPRSALFNFTLMVWLWLSGSSMVRFSSTTSATWS